MWSNTRRTLLLIVAGVFPVLGPSARAVVAANESQGLKPITTNNGRPVFTIPANSRLARNEHPRCLLTADDLVRVKRRLADRRIARELETIKARSLGDRPWILEQALAYRLTGDRRFLEAMMRNKEWDQPTWIFGWPAAIDLVWDDLSPQQRTALSDAVVRAVSRNGSLYWRPTLHLVSVF